MNEISAATAKVAEVIANMTELMEPLFEAAIGVRERMIEEGWSPTAAEQTAQLVLSQWIVKVSG